MNWHLQIMNVSQSSFILIQPANDAIRELKGCIAPVCLPVIGDLFIMIILLSYLISAVFYN